MLKLENLTIRFGGLTAVDNVTTHVEQGEIFGLVGPNGAGKTTTFNMISGYYAPTRGKVIFDGQEIQGKPQYEINRLGIARTYQNINLFNKMTVLENCMIGCHPRMKANIFDAIFNTPRKRREDADAEEKCRKILKFMDLGHREDYLAKNLSYGEQRRLEIARALVSDPKLLLLDEPAAGMNSTEKDELSGMIKSIRNMGITVLLVEHNMKLVMGVCDRICVLNFGEKLAEGTPEYILQVKDLHFWYGEIHALKGISLNVEKNGVVSLLGANGAGKTTTLQYISGLIKGKHAGEIWYMGQRIDGKSAHTLSKIGIAQCIEGRRIFSQLSVRENLMMGAYLCRDNAKIKRNLEYVFTLFPRLLEREKQMGGTLSGGEQQMLAVGRALMQDPKLLMMDEPSLGLAPLLIEEVFRAIKKIKEDGLPILLVEQNSKAALQVADRGYVLEVGELVLEDTAENLLHNEAIKKSYLGMG